MWSISHEKAPRGPGTSARKSRFMHACVCKWMSSLHAFAILFSGCVHMQNSKPVTWLKCQVVHLQLFWPQVEISLRFQLACLASSAKQADWLNLSKFCWFRRHWSCGPRCRDCSSGPSTKSLNCLRFRLLKMVKTLQPLLLLRVRRVLISKAKMLDTTSWSVAAGTFSCDQLNHFFCSFIVLNFCDIEWTEHVGLFFRWIAAVVSHFQTSNFHHLSQAAWGSPTKPERLKTSVRSSICVHTHNVWTIACTCSFSIFASTRIFLAKTHAHAKRLEQTVIFLEVSYAWKFQNGNATVAWLHIGSL